ncbi:MAG: prephenate dehydratase, partial [Actinomycetota bacterium]|nr:prephenate dehydratase [Actinomycetota bacterium]
MRVAYLGPAGTFSEDALRQSGFVPAGPEGFSPMPVATLPAVVSSVSSGEADRALVPVENSIEGSVRPTLDGLIEHADRVRIAGEYDHPVRSALISRSGHPLDAIEVVVSHPQPLAQCARFLAEALPEAELRVASSTSAAVREVAETDRPWAALAPASAAAIYGCEILREGIEDEPGNVTRFLWLEPRDELSSCHRASQETQGESGIWKTTLVFAELGADHPGALVDALLEFSSREINLVRIESRPLRRELGRYRFFIDIEGRESDPVVAEAISALRTKAE